MTELMRSSDAFTWEMEHEPGLRSTVVTIFVLDRTPDWDELLERFERMAATLPMFRQRVVENPPPTPPRWEEDPDFDLAFHLHRVVAPPPGSFDSVLEMARRSLERKFRQMTGRTPLDEIRRLRLNRVKELLAMTDRSVADIADATGFGTPAYMTATFRQSERITPLRYRRQVRGL